MAERRMFAKTIVTSDAFLDMPPTARCLYFTLAMFADDDGFVNNPKSIMRQSGASTDDMNILITKKFVITFESGVIVIKHWRIHNYIQSDRYHETKYKDEKNALMLDDNKSYTLADTAIEALDTECIHDVSIVDTEDRLGKDSIGKVSKKKKENVYEGLPDNLKNTLGEFEEMRKSIKKPMTDVARKRLIRELQKLAGEDVQMMIQILDQSILNSWAGVYPLKNNTKGIQQGSGNPFADMLQKGNY